MWLLYMWLNPVNYKFFSLKPKTLFPYLVSKYNPAIYHENVFYIIIIIIIII